MKAFKKEIESVINRYSKENGSNTPDFILAEYLLNCLKNFDTATNLRENWYGHKPDLIKAAKEIDRLRNRQKERTEAFQKLAIDARNGVDRKEIDRRKRELDETVVVDFGTAIDRLCNALHSR